jgi:hypothetical protein
MRSGNPSPPHLAILLNVLTIYTHIIYTVPCVMFLMRAVTLHGQVGGGWALEMESFESEMASS